MPSFYSYVPPEEEEYNPELAPQPVALPDGSTYTGEQAAAPTNYVPGSTYIPPGAAESPQTAGPPPEPAYNITGGGDYTGEPVPAPTSYATEPVGGNDTISPVPSSQGYGTAYYASDPAQPAATGAPAPSLGAINGWLDNQIGRRVEPGPTTNPPVTRLPATGEGGVPISPSMYLGGPSEYFSKTRIGNVQHPQGTGRSNSPASPPPTYGSGAPVSPSNYTSAATRSEFGWDDLNRSHGSGRTAPYNLPRYPTAQGNHSNTLGGESSGPVVPTPEQTPPGAMQWPPVYEDHTREGNPVPPGGYTSRSETRNGITLGEQYAPTTIGGGNTGGIRRTSSATPRPAPTTLSPASETPTKQTGSVSDAFGQGMGGPAKDAVAGALTLAGAVKDNSATQARSDLGIIGTGGYRTGPTAALTGLFPPLPKKNTGTTTATTPTGRVGPAARVAADPAVDSAGRDLTGPEWQSLLTGGGGETLPFVDADGNPTQETLDASTKDGYMVKNDDGTYTWADGTPVSRDTLLQKVRDIAAGKLVPVGTQADGNLAAEPLPVTPVETSTTGSTTSNGGGGGTWQDWGSNGGGKRSWSSGGGGGGGGWSGGSGGGRRSGSAGFDFDSFFADFMGGRFKGMGGGEPVDLDGDGKISAKEAKMAKKGRGRKGRMGKGGAMMPGMPGADGIPGDFRSYILEQLGEGFGRPVGGWPEAQAAAPADGKKKKK